MITKNYENLLASILEASSGATGGLPVINVNGVTRFKTGKFGSTFPAGVTASTTLSATSAGISVGTGDAAESPNSVNLENTITSGVSLSVTATNGCEAPGIRYLDYQVTVTNTGSEAITVREIGYKQPIYAARIPGSISDLSEVYLFDRTVLDPALVIQAGDAGVIKYRLAAKYRKKQKNGVNLYPFTYATDADVAIMIDAAREGLIDLQADAGWAVGDVRTIHLAAFTGGGSTAHAAQDAEIVISQFGDYNDCGCLFQFDFVNCLATEQRPNGTRTNVGGYGETEMYLTTLPAMVEALPEWLRTRLKTFSVLTGKGGGSSEVESVPNNKLALRAEVEVLGTNQKSAEGEGSQVSRYAYAETRKKVKARAAASPSNIAWSLRSPKPGSSTSTCLITSNGDINDYYPDTTEGLSPFGCI